MTETLTPDPPAPPASRELPALPNGYVWWDCRTMGFIAVIGDADLDAMWIDECCKGGDYFWAIRGRPDRLSFWEAVHLASTLVWMGETK